MKVPFEPKPKATIEDLRTHRELMNVVRYIDYLEDCLTPVQSPVDLTLLVEQAFIDHKAPHDYELICTIARRLGAVQSSVVPSVQLIAEGIALALMGVEWDTCGIFTKLQITQDAEKVRTHLLTHGWREGTDEGMSCSKCDGNGWTAEHDTGPMSHDEDGSCNGSCPVQVPCEDCQGTGKIRATPVPSKGDDVREALDRSNVDTETVLEWLRPWFEKNWLLAEEDLPHVDRLATKIAHLTRQSGPDWTEVDRNQIQGLVSERNRLWRALEQISSCDKAGNAVADRWYMIEIARTAMAPKAPNA